MKISVIICTYNRAALLEECLQSLVIQTLALSAFEVVVVDNHSSDETAATAKRFESIFPNFRYTFEPKQGLSHARNRGFREASADWVLFLDDDAKAADNMLERAVQTIEKQPFKLFGGVALPWYKHPKPHWFKDKYGTINQLNYSRVSKLKSNEYAIGGIMVVHKPLLEKYGGFDTHLGMSGAKVAYNEEVELQLRLRRDGIAIGHDPALRIYHLVAPYKMEVDWFFKAAFAQGRDNLISKNISTHPIYLFLIAIIAFGMMLVHLVIYTPRLLQRHYYIQNWLIDVFRKVAKRVGTVYTGLLYNEKKRH